MFTKNKEYDSSIFESDLRFFREWFRMHERQNKEKFDFFYGPLTSDNEKQRLINKKRLQRQHVRLKRLTSITEDSDVDFNDLENFYMDFEDAPKTVTETT